MMLRDLFQSAPWAVVLLAGPVVFATNETHAQFTTIAVQSFEGNSTTDFVIDVDDIDGDGSTTDTVFPVNDVSQAAELVLVPGLVNTFNGLNEFTIFDETAQPFVDANGTPITTFGGPVFEFTGTGTGRVDDSNSQQADPNSPGETADALGFRVLFTNSRVSASSNLIEVAEEASNFLLDLASGGIFGRTLPPGITLTTPAGASVSLADAAVTPSDLDPTTDIFVNDPFGVPVEFAGIDPGPDAQVLGGVIGLPVIEVQGVTVDTTFVVPGVSNSSGDFNFDGVVNAADFVAGRDLAGTTPTSITVPDSNDEDGFATTITLAVGDAVGGLDVDGNAVPDGAIDSTDLALVTGNFGATVLGIVDADGDINNGVTGPEGGDLIGVVSDALGADSPLNEGVGVSSADSGVLTAPEGSNAFLVNDTDGAIILEFDTVDTSDFNSVGVTFSLAVNDSGFEEFQGDSFSIFANGEEIFTLEGDSAQQFGATVDEDGDPLPVGLDDPALNGQGFQTEFLPLDSVIGPDGLLQLSFVFDTSAGGENIAIDNIFIDGVLQASPATSSAVPEPTSLALVGAFLWGLAARRSRTA